MASTLHRIVQRRGGPSSRRIGGQIVSSDFFSVEVWTKRGLRTHYVLFFLDLETRRVHFGGLTWHPNDTFMAQAARGLPRFLMGKRFLICDRDTKYSKKFCAMLPERMKVHRTPFQAPNANAHAERFVRSIKSECLSRMIWFGEEPLRKAIFEFLEHYPQERNHQGLANELIETRPKATMGEVVSRERLGGLLKHYGRAA